MSNETTQPTSQIRLSQEEAQTLYDQEAKQAEADRLAGSKFVKLKDGEQKEFILTGVVYKDMKTFDPKQGEKTMLSFELAEKNAKGENKQFSTSARAGVAGELLKAIKEHKLKVVIKRMGEGSKTTYMVLAGSV